MSTNNTDILIELLCDPRAYKITLHRLMSLILRLCCGFHMRHPQSKSSIFITEQRATSISTRTKDTHYCDCCRSNLHNWDYCFISTLPAKLECKWDILGHMVPYNTKPVQSIHPICSLDTNNKSSPLLFTEKEISSARSHGQETSN